MKSNNSSTFTSFHFSSVARTSSWASASENVQKSLKMSFCIFFYRATDVKVFYVFCTCTEENVKVHEALASCCCITCRSSSAVRSTSAKRSWGTMPQCHGSLLCERKKQVCKKNEHLHESSTGESFMYYLLLCRLNGNIEYFHLDLPPQVPSSRYWGGSHTPQIQQNHNKNSKNWCKFVTNCIGLALPINCGLMAAKSRGFTDDNCDRTVEVEMICFKSDVYQQKHIYTFKNDESDLPFPMISNVSNDSLHWNLDVCFTNPRDKAVAACSTKSCVFSSFQRAACSPWHKNKPAFLSGSQFMVPVLVSVVPSDSPFVQEDFMWDCPSSSPNKSSAGGGAWNGCMFDHSTWHNHHQKQLWGSKLSTHQVISTYQLYVLCLVTHHDFQCRNLTWAVFHRSSLHLSLYQNVNKQPYVVSQSLRVCLRNAYATAVFACAGHMLIPLTQLACASLRDSGFCLRKPLMTQLLQLT